MEQFPGGKRVAFFGGSFDPPHLGHLAVARAARAALALDTVLFAPVGAQPLKPHGSAASFDDRLAMTCLAIAGEEGFMVSLADAPKLSAAPNFTVDTLLALRTELLPDGALFCLMGADAFFGLRGWRRSGEIPFVAPLIVASRPGQKLAGLKAALPPGLTMESASLTDQNGPKVPGSAGEVRSFLLHNPGGDTAPFYLLPGLHIEISASQVRDEIRDEIQDQDRDEVRARSGSPIASHKFLPNAVFDYIRARGLYR